VAGVLVVADREGNIYGLDPATGKESWSAVIPESGMLANPLVMDNEVFLTARNGDLWRVDGETGGLARVAAAP
jgi:outer membrane protein assembly factor BamB